MAGGRVVVIVYDFLRGPQNETVVKELCVASATAAKTFPFQESLKDVGSRLVRERSKLGRRTYRI